jgi:hypothetical protein
MKARILLAVAGALSLIGMGAGITLAATATSGPTMIYACYSNKTHEMFHSATASCPSGQTLLKWTAGTPTSGPSGLDLYVSVASGPGAPGSSYTVTARCPKSHPWATGGGYYNDTSHSGGTVNASYPAPENFSKGVYGGWTVMGGGPAPITVYAICSK